MSDLAVHARIQQLERGNEEIQPSSRDQGAVDLPQSSNVVLDVFQHVQAEYVLRLRCAELVEHPENRETLLAQPSLQDGLRLDAHDLHAALAQSAVEGADTRTEVDRDVDSARVRQHLIHQVGVVVARLEHHLEVVDSCVAVDSHPLPSSRFASFRQKRKVSL